MFIQNFSVSRLYLSYMHLQTLRLKPNINGRFFSRLKTSYIVLLPEVPEDTAETNSLLNHSNLPNFSELTAEKCYNGLGKHCLDYETGIWKIEEKIKDGAISKTFGNIIDEMDKLDAPLSYAWSTVKTLYSVRNDELNTANYLKIHERARKARGYKFQSQPIYEACKEIYVKENLSEPQKRVIRKFLLESRLNGVELTKKERGLFTLTIKNLDEYKSTYRNNLQESSKKFSYRIIDHDIVRDFPDDLLQNMSDNSKDYLKGPWTVTHHPLIYHKFLENCPHKDLRYNAWKGYVMRASPSVLQELSNARLVEQIRGCRLDQAKVLGFKTFGDMSMETKMAGTVENILSVIANLFVKAKEKQSKEMDTLVEFAQSHGFREELEECDVPYWRRKELLYLTKANEIQLNEYFPFNHVWHQLLSFCSNLFGVHFEEVSPGHVSTWHSDVQFYNVLDSDGKKISSFYLDPYRRPHQKLYAHENPAWMVTLKSRCDIVNASPVATLIFNFPEPSPENNTPLLSLADVERLFKKFGHALPHLLSSVPHGETSGLRNIEWDAVEVCPNFLLNWLYEPSVLEKISKHHESGQPLDKSGIKCVLMSRSHMAAYDMCRELFLSHLDIKLYTEETYWLEILKELWPLYMPFELHRFNAIPCWFSAIMSDIWAATYYSHLWSKMLAADAFRAFQECEPQEITDVGKRFRKTFLSLGGGCHSADVFRQFRGRDPSPEALAIILGIS